MSSSGPRSGERVIHQDFIARIRYSNALPAPPNPPKLLDIPNTGLSSGQYTTPGFASRLAREQPLNIEADAELGMPLDLVGMPGVFDGDESSIQAPAHPPPVHPHDKPLLRPIAALGKPKVAEANVSFLRRTEYISSLATKRFEGNSPRALLMKAKRPVPRQAEAAANAPQTIKRKIERSFDVAEEELKDPKRIRHPTKKHLKAVEVTPLLPDLDAFPDSGAYVTIKFLTNPMAGGGGGSGSKFDARLLSSLFRPIDKTENEERSYEAALAAHEADPVGNPKPQNLMNYDFYLGDGPAVGRNFRRKFDVDDPEHGDDALYTERAAGAGCFQFNRVRAYETAQEIELDHATKYQDEVLLAFNDDEAYPRQRAVYYYPVMQKSTVRPQRTKNIARTAGIYEEEQIVDQLDITVDDPTEEMRDAMRRYRQQPLGWEQEEEGEEEQQQEEVLAEQPEEDGDAEDTNARHRSPLEAEGDEDED
ncbi:RNA polymerase II-associated, Paf1 [Cordyceps fumosorosea ARSEF 2679]|uniref:RNA polymerase II-associated, Paf1 n=1 Tax=Cordyceps fumosorosea (strain ARSEF 2679) TaxID=1081104 RepID=A0A167ZDR2_CORFA|nr:RNA polymerase II-associated, Paf1 [Cordyceps fumosorosea ARSEF 2679]OAA67385.1 RNA polymerase II-associated, Paf1 [Cordyceps fumosorosea ARSEF 2679]